MPNFPATHSCRVDAPKHTVPEAKHHVYARQAKRALHTADSAWLKIRAAVLRKEPLCRECKKNGMITEAKHIDHIDGDASTYHSNRPENLQPLCVSCHNAKTAKEMNHV